MLATLLSSKKSDNTLKFGNNLVISSGEKVRIYHQIFSQFFFILLLSDISQKKNTGRSEHEIGWGPLQNVSFQLFQSSGIYRKVTLSSS
jgi:hypothetical protein